MRTVAFDVPPQEILTRDSVTINVDAVVYYKVASPMNATCNVVDYARSTKLLASTTLRTTLGTHTLTEILSEREIIAETILQHMDVATDPWGIRVSIRFIDILFKNDFLVTPRLCDFYFIFENFILYTFF